MVVKNIVLPFFLKSFLKRSHFSLLIWNRLCFVHFDEASDDTDRIYSEPILAVTHPYYTKLHVLWYRILLSSYFLSITISWPSSLLAHSLFNRISRGMYPVPHNSGPPLLPRRWFWYLKCSLMTGVWLQFVRKRLELIPAGQFYFLYTREQITGTHWQMWKSHGQP